MLKRLLVDETGVVISAELILIITIVFCAAAVGWSTVGSAIASELDDISEMVGVVDQSFNVVAHTAPVGETLSHGSCGAFGFNDLDDDCDCLGIVLVSTAGKSQDGSGSAESGDTAGG